MLMWDARMHVNTKSQNSYIYMWNYFHYIKIGISISKDKNKCIKPLLWGINFSVLWCIGTLFNHAPLFRCIFSNNLFFFCLLLSHGDAHNHYHCCTWRVDHTCAALHYLTKWWVIIHTWTWSTTKSFIPLPRLVIF